MRIRSVHYELTDLCNARCPQCARTESATCRPHDWLARDACTLERFERLSPRAFLAKLESAYFCGNFGDPAVVRDLIDIVRYCFEANPGLWLALHTNAGVRTEDWWRALAQATRGRRFRVIAGIDGVTPESHARYRVGTDLDRVMANLGAFIDEGGVADWRMIVFAHNEDEVEAARSLAGARGFAEFRAYPSDRFEGRKAHHYTHRGVEATLEPARGALAPKLTGLRELAPGDVATAEVHIECDALRSESAFITFEGDLLPCCYVGGRFYKHRHGALGGAEADAAAIFDGFDMSLLNIEASGFWQAVSGYGAFMKLLETHWPGQGPRVCKAVCGRRRPAAA